MERLRKYTFFVLLLTGSLACSLISAPAGPTATIQPSPTIFSTDTPALTATAEASDTPAPTELISSTDTSIPGMPSLPLAMLNMMNVAQYFNPVGQPVQTWHDVPIMPQATAGQEYKSGGVYSFKATATISQGVNFYMPKMTAMGFMLNGAGPATGSAGTGSDATHGSTLFYFKGSQIFLIDITSFDTDPGHIIVVMSTQ